MASRTYISAAAAAAILLLFLAPSSLALSVLYSGETLYTGQSLVYGNYEFVMQDDCNLVLYDKGIPVWNTFTYGRGINCILRMQSDGNLVIYSNNYPVWASNSNRGEGYYVLIVQPDRNVVNYGTAIWATDTHTDSHLGIASPRNSTEAPAVVVAGPPKELGNRKIIAMDHGDQGCMIAPSL